MPFPRPTFTEINDRIKADIDSRLEGADSKLRRSILNVLAFVVAGGTHGLYGYLDFIARQAFPDTAEVEFLNRWGSIWGVTRRAASKAAGNIEATGINGTVIPEGTELQRSDGTEYVTTAEATIASGTATIEVEAVVAALAGNTEASSTLSFISPPAGIDSNVTADADGLTGGADVESDESYLARLLARIQEPPHGGAEFDYEAWALEVAGVTRVWVYPLELGAGTVTVRFMMDDTYEDGIPETDDVETVQEYIEERRPVTADVTVLAPVADVLNFTIHLNQGDTTAIRAAVEAELRDMIRRDAIPGGTIYLSRINEAISIATGEYDHTLTVPAANVTHTTGHIATMGIITWT
jgi:uncharacterized phage protein gp47/JayE